MRHICTFNPPFDVTDGQLWEGDGAGNNGQGAGRTTATTGAGRQGQRGAAGTTEQQREPARHQLGLPTPKTDPDGFRPTV
jgi:hypothetical protein